MSVLKLCLGVALLILSTIIARQYASKFKQKFEYYSSLVTMLNSINAELIYTKRLIQEAVNVEYTSKDFAKTVNSVYFEGEPTFPKYLTKQEIEKLKLTFGSLGKGDANAQKLVVSGYLQEFGDITRELNCKYKKNYQTIIKVGFLIGMMLLLMVI